MGEHDTDVDELRPTFDEDATPTDEIDPLCHVCRGGRIFVSRATVGGSSETRFDHCPACNAKGTVSQATLDAWHAANPNGVVDVPDEPTPVAVAELYASLRRAWVSRFNASPRRASLLCLLSQWALETGRGKHCHNWNLGNVKWSPGYTRTMFRCSEVGTDGKERYFDPPHPCTWFRAFEDLDHGVADYLHVLHDGHFAPAWASVEAGDVHAFAVELKALGYYTASEALYERGVASLFAEFDAAIPPDPDTAAVVGGIQERPFDPEGEPA